MQLARASLFILAASAAAASDDWPAYDSSYVHMSVRNKATGGERTVCANYQQYTWRAIAATKEQAPPLRLDWWSLPGAYDVCARRAAGAKPLAGALVPLEYRLRNRSHLCPDLGAPGDAWSKYFPYQLEQTMEQRAGADLFLVRRGEQYFTDYRDFLFSDFRDATAWQALGRNLTVPTFYYYMGDGYFDDILAMSRDVNGSELEFRFHRPPSYPVDVAMVIVFAIAECCVVVGGLCSARRRYELARR